MFMNVRYANYFRREANCCREAHIFCGLNARVTCDLHANSWCYIWWTKFLIWRPLEVVNVVMKISCCEDAFFNFQENDIFISVRVISFLLIKNYHAIYFLTIFIRFWISYTAAILRSTCLIYILHFRFTRFNKITFPSNYWTKTRFADINFYVLYTYNRHHEQRDCCNLKILNFC
jgi:hypothetical protein